MCKKMTFFIAVCLFATATAFANVQVNETNFPDPNFRAWILAQPWGSDGVITDEEIAGITYISVFFRNISDLTGIEIFTNLQILHSSGNPLTSLDVSNLTNLWWLRLGGNLLTSLDVSSLTNLASLDVSNNRLASLDVSNLTNLQTLRAHNNQLTSLDVSDLTNLVYLDVHTNRLTSLDVSGLFNLTSLRVHYNLMNDESDVVGFNGAWDDEYFRFNPQTMVAVEINEMNFPDPNFRNWILAQPWGSDSVTTGAEIAGITMILVTRRNISDLTGINFFTNLTELWVNSNYLTSLDVSNLTNLQQLEVGGNQLTSLDISNLTNLTVLGAGSNQLTSLVVSNLTNFSILNVGMNQLTSLDLDTSNLTNLILLNVQGNQLTSLDTSNLADNVWFMGHNQTPTLTLTGANDNYNLAIDLNNPTNLVYGLSFSNGILTSTSNAITSSPFTVETGNPNFALSGTLTLNYETRIVTPTENSVTIEWVHVEGAEYYIIVVYADEARTIVLFTIKIDAQGNIIRTSRSSRSGAPLLSHTITGLDSNTQFFYSITALDSEEEIIGEPSTGSFTTLAPTNVPEINLNRTPVAFYTITGVRLGQKPQSGIFIILYCDGSAERVMR